MLPWQMAGIKIVFDVFLFKVLNFYGFTFSFS